MDWSLLGFQGLSQVFNVHPVFVHFPIALFPTAFLFYFLAVILKRDRFAAAGQVCLVLSLIATLLAVATGYIAQDTFEHGEAIHRMMETHQLIGYAVLGLATVTTLWSFARSEGRPRAPKLFLTLLAATILLTLQNADLGGRMVFVEGAAVKAVLPAESEAAVPGTAAGEKEHGPHEHGDHH